MNLTLGRKLFLLVAIPLTGALIFAGAIVVGLTSESRSLRRAETSTRFTAALVTLRRAVAAEQIASWNSAAGQNGRKEFQSRVAETELAFAALRTCVSSTASSGLLSTDVRDTAAAIIAHGTQLTNTRSYFLQPSRKASLRDEPSAGHRSRYRAVVAQVIELVERLNQESDSVPLRSRLDALAWFAHLAQAAEEERSLYELGFTTDRLTIAEFVRLQSATAQRLYFESNLVLMARPESRDFWSTLLGSPAYAAIQPLQSQILNTSSPESQPFKAALRAKWTEASLARNQVLDTVEPHLLAELSEYLATTRANVDRQIQITGTLLGIVLLVSLTIAGFMIRKTNLLFQRALKGLNDGVTAMLSAVRMSSQGAKQLAQSASREAAGLEETNAALLTLTTVNQQNASAARQTADHMQQTGMLVGSSRESMRALSDTMSKISDSSHATSRIVKTISEISFQTSILALNASIEAASAGSAGTGFAVVADEVRSLAKRASDATAETSRLVDESTAAVNRGSELTREVEEALAGLEANAAGSAELMGSIHAASQQMLSHLQQITAGSRAMEAVSQQNAAIADHNAETAGAISLETDQLQATIRILGETLGGQTTRV